MDKVESIEPDGVEDVFDVQIERTENFIANGLVSHNTRWHPEDIWHHVVDPDRWIVLRMPALCDYDPADPDPYCQAPDPLGRQQGEVLCPELWPLKKLLEIKATVSEYTWLSLYQGRPTFRDGLFFSVKSFKQEMNLEPIQQWIRYYDLAASDDPDACFTAAVLMGITRSGQLVIGHVDRIQAGPHERDRWQRRLADQDAAALGYVRQVEELQPGAAGKDRGRAFARLMAGFGHGLDNPSGDKITRADPYASHVGAGLVTIQPIDVYGQDQRKRIGEFLTEHAQFPMSAQKDYVDAASGAFGCLVRKKSAQIEAEKPPVWSKEDWGKNRGRAGRRQVK